MSLVREQVRPDGMVDRSQFFYNNISTLFAEKTSPAPAEGYLMIRNLAAGPAPDLYVSGVEVWILLRDRSGIDCVLPGSYLPELFEDLVEEYPKPVEWVLPIL